MKIRVRNIGSSILSETSSNHARTWCIFLCWFHAEGTWSKRMSSWWIANCDFLQMFGWRSWLHLEPRDSKSALNLSIWGWRFADFTPAQSWHLHSHFFVLFGGLFSHWMFKHFERCVVVCVQGIAVINNNITTTVNSSDLKHLWKFSIVQIIWKQKGLFWKTEQNLKSCKDSPIIQQCWRHYMEKVGNKTKLSLRRNTLVIGSQNIPLEF